MHCNGQCQLMKKMQEEEKKNQQNPERKLEHKVEIALSSKSFFPEIIYYSTDVPSVFETITIGTIQEMPRSVFHPPAV